MPENSGMKNIYQQVLQKIRTGQKIVWATVIRIAGSTPQKPGSAALYDRDGLCVGTVGGGVMEGRVGILANRLLAEGGSNVFHFDLDSDVHGEGSICGGKADILIDAEPGLNRKALEELENDLTQRKKGWLLTFIGREKEGSRTIHRYWIPGSGSEHPHSGWPESLRKYPSISRLMERADLFPFTELDEVESPEYAYAFLEPVKPKPRLVIAGAGHVGKALSHLGHLLDFEVTVIDDRPEFASPALLPDADEVIVKNTGEAMEEVVPDHETYVVIVTRGHQYDGEALKPLIGSESAYIGMIGSHRKVAVMKKMFLEMGWATPEQWDKIFTPVGLPIGSKTVQEVAVSIAAQLVSVRNANRIKDGK